MVCVAFASETGTAEALAWRCCSYLALRGVSVDGPHALDALDLPALAAPLVLFAATCGDGACPANGKKTWASLLRKAHARVACPYALYGLGDARYGLKFNAFARKVDARLAQLGASRLAPRALGDAAAAGGSVETNHRFGSARATLKPPYLAQIRSLFGSFRRDRVLVSASKISGGLGPILLAESVRIGPC